MVRTAKIGNANFLAAEIRRVVNLLARDEAVFIFIVNSCGDRQVGTRSDCSSRRSCDIGRSGYSPDPRLEQCRAARDGQ